MTKTLTTKQAISALPRKLHDDWITQVEGEGIEIDEDNRRTFQSAFYWAVRAALEELAPVTLVPTPDEDKDELDKLTGLA